MMGSQCRVSAVEADRVDLFEDEQGCFPFRRVPDGIIGCVMVDGPGFLRAGDRVPGDFPFHYGFLQAYFARIYSLTQLADRSMNNTTRISTRIRMIQVASFAGARSIIFDLLYPVEPVS